MEEMVKYLKALTFLQLQTATGTNPFGKTELLLHRAGFSNREIGELLGKKEGAISMAIQRAKAALAKEAE